MESIFDLLEKLSPNIKKELFTKAVISGSIFGSLGLQEQTMLVKLLSFDQSSSIGVESKLLDTFKSMIQYGILARNEEQYFLNPSFREGFLLFLSGNYQ